MPMLILGLSYFFIIKGLGLSGIGYAWVIGQEIISWGYLVVGGWEG